VGANFSLLKQPKEGKVADRLNRLAVSWSASAMNELKRHCSKYDYFLLVAFMILLGTGVVIIAQSDGRGLGYHSGVERLWERITNPRQSNRCENALKQMPLAAPAAVQTGKETK
jgi:hypothetical protein